MAKQAQNPQALPMPKPLTFMELRRLAAAKRAEFRLISKFPYGYRNREDKTNTAPSTLIQGSQNVITDVTGRINSVKGYTLDGASSSVLAPILASYDWQTHVGPIQHLRAGFLTTAGNDGKLQFRYVNSAGTVTWTDLLTSLTGVKFQFADWWDATNSQSYLLMVNGDKNVYEWSGGTATFASATSNTITLQGTSTFAQLGFYVTGTNHVIINGVDYTVTGGWGTTTLTGVTPDPTGVTINVGDLIFQKVKTTAISGFTSGPPTSFTTDGIANLRNQIYLGSLTFNTVYISKVNDYTNYAFSTPRVVGEGALVTMDAPWIGFATQESSMYMAAGQNNWYQTQFTLSSDLAKEAFQIIPLKTGTQQGAMSQQLIWKDPNNVTFVSNEPAMNFLGRVNKVLDTPQITNLSNPIINDFNTYDFTDASGIYFQKMHYVAVPQESVVRIYNMTNPKQIYWEAPILYPISRFSIIDGELYGHSYTTSESYKLFTGYDFNSHPYSCVAQFAYNNYGTPHLSKSFNRHYSEGYITAPTILNVSFLYDTSGDQNQSLTPFKGTNVAVDNLPSTSPLGKEAEGINPLGGDLQVSTNTSTPPKFRVYQTSLRTPFYEESTIYSSMGINQTWSLLRFGPAQETTSEESTDITQ